MQKTLLLTVSLISVSAWIVSCNNQTPTNNQHADDATEQVVTRTEVNVMDGTIQLLNPDMTRTTSVMQALSDRKSTREFSSQSLSLEDLSNVLWAANGVNRADSNRTAPSAMKAMDIDVYACLQNGTFLYHPTEHKLTKVADEDLRPSIYLQQQSIADAPLILLMVSNTDKFPKRDGQPSGMAEKFGGMDAAYVSENICIYCAGAGLATVPRAMMDVAKIKEVLKLTDSQIPMLNNPVGYFK